MQLVIESHQLRLFVMLARLLNMSRVADELRMTPSAVSHALKAMEADLGCVLFERTSRSIKLTPAGEALLPEAQAILDGMESLRLRAGSIMDADRRHIRIGTTEAVCHRILPDILRIFCERFPEYTVCIDSGSGRRMAESLSSDRIDLAIVPMQPDCTGMESVPLASDTLHLVAHPSHPWVISPDGSQAMGPETKLIRSRVDDSVCALVEGTFPKGKRSMRHSIEVPNEEAVKRFVCLNMGIGLLPHWMVAEEIAKGLLVALPQEKGLATRQWCVFYAKGRNLSDAEQQLMDICRERIQSVMNVVGS